MLAMVGDAPLQDDRLVYEPKYDGIRALIAVEPGQGARGVAILSRLGNEKTSQFPEIVQALERFGRTLKAPVVLDGEIVALDEAGEPAGFQRLQGRIHLTKARDIATARRQPVAFVAFDALRDGGADLRPLPLTARRARLERIHGNAGSEVFRLSEFVAGDGRALNHDALARGLEGLIAKRVDSTYQSGRRSHDWTKVKLLRRQEFVVAGWTEPRQTRTHFGALLLGVYDDGALVYVGHTGTGFSHVELERLARLMTPLRTEACPFRTRPKTNERPHWVRPELVAEVTFSEWTEDGKLRHPAYLGLRDDVRPERVQREPIPTRRAGVIARERGGRQDPRSLGQDRRRAPAADHEGVAWATPTRGLAGPLARLIRELEDLESGRRGGILTLPDGARLEVSNLHKVLWPGPRITKGELIRYDIGVSPLLLPVVADRPLVMKRFPNGVKSKAFYQQRAPADVPDGVRVEVLPSDVEVPSRLVGGSLLTLIYMAQLAVVSQDPWFSRVQSPDDADHVAFDLDPMPGVSFARVVDVARWVHDELERLGAPSAVKTSGADGLHVYVPLPPGTSYEAGRLFCQIIATLVADRHPRVATVERAVNARGRTVYIDYLQNIRGKTLAGAYSARATDFAGVSTPLAWHELDDSLDRRDFTMRSVPERLRSVGDLWAPLRTSRGADLHAALRYVDAPAARALEGRAARRTS